MSSYVTVSKCGRSASTRRFTDFTVLSAWPHDPELNGRTRTIMHRSCCSAWWCYLDCYQLGRMLEETWAWLCGNGRWCWHLYLQARDCWSMVIAQISDRTCSEGTILHRLQNITIVSPLHSSEQTRGRPSDVDALCNGVQGPL